MDETLGGLTQILVNYENPIIQRFGKNLDKIKNPLLLELVLNCLNTNPIPCYQIPFHKLKGFSFKHFKKNIYIFFF